jgi:hypothetical protein
MNDHSESRHPTGRTAPPPASMLDQQRQAERPLAVNKPALNQPPEVLAPPEPPDLTAGAAHALLRLLLRAREPTDIPQDGSHNPDT